MPASGPAARPALAQRERTRARRVLDCGGVRVEVRSDDAAALDYVVEYFDPWFQATSGVAEWLLAVTTDASAYDDMRRRQPAQAPPQPCFAHDQQVMSMPAWASGDGVAVRDAERACFLRIGPRRVDLVAEPRTRRWRFTLLWVVQEIAATRLRRSHVDLHAGAVERDGHALVIAGPKHAGKTTLALHLMERHGCNLIANDRGFIAGAAASFAVAGMPTAVKIRPPTLARFPQLQRGLPAVARPYLYTQAELETATPTDERPETVEFALTPNQIAARLGVDARAAAPLAAMLFPRVSADEATWTIEPVGAADLTTAMLGALYGAAARARPPTLFEQFGGGPCLRPPPDLVDAIAAAVPGYRVRLGRDAYADTSLGERLLRLLS